MVVTEHMWGLRPPAGSQAEQRAGAQKAVFERDLPYHAGLVSRVTALSLTLMLTLASACQADYGSVAPAGLDDAPSVGDGELVFERQLRWWDEPMLQRARLYVRSDGSYLLLRQHSIGPEVYGWGEGTLTEVGEQRRSTALDSADPTMTEPAPGDYDCTYVDVLPAAVYVDDERISYLSLCPPEGVTELVAFYGDLVELLLDCPLDEGWYEGELPLTQSACAEI